MTLWILWSMFISALIALGAAAAERAAAYVDVPRRFVWIAAMAISALAPFAVALRHAPVIPSQPIVATSVATRVQGPPQREDARTSGLSAAEGVVIIPAPAAPPSRRERIVARISAFTRAVDPWLARLWLAASLSLLIVFGRELLRLRRQRAHWREADVDSCSALVASDAGPAVVGFAHPRIVVPEWALVLDQNARALLLRHETEHIRAGDPRALLGSLLLLIAFPWNAALWWMSLQLRLAIEIDCDARVIRAVGATRDYGMVLLAVSERFTTPLPLAASLAEPRRTLERRIHAMSAPRQRRPLLSALPFGLVALVAITVAARAPRPKALAIGHAVTHPSTPAVRVAPNVLTGAPGAGHVPNAETPALRPASRTTGQDFPRSRDSGSPTSAQTAAPTCALTATPRDSGDGFPMRTVSGAPYAGVISLQPGGSPTTPAGVPLQPIIRFDTINGNTVAQVAQRRDAQGLVHGFVLFVRGRDAWNDRSPQAFAGNILPDAMRITPNRALDSAIQRAEAGDSTPLAALVAEAQSRSLPPAGRRLAPAWIPGDSAWPDEHGNLSGTGGFLRNGFYSFSFSFQTNTVTIDYGFRTASLVDGNVLLLKDVDGVAGPPQLIVAGCVPITPTGGLVARALASLPAVRDFVR